MSLNDAVHWSASLGGGTRVALVQAGTFLIRRRGRSSGRCRGCSGSATSRPSSTDDHRLLQALNCLLVETPAGRVLVETGIGERVDDKLRAMPGLRRRPDPAGAARRPGSIRRRVDVVAMSHLHFDHAGGLLDGPTAGAPSRGRRSSPSAPSGRSRSATTRGSSRATTSPSSGSSATGAPRAGPTASASCCPACRSSRPAVTRPATRRSSSGAAERAAGRWPSSATWRCGRGAPTRAGSPRSTTSRSTRSLVKGELFARAAAEDWTVVLSHERRQPDRPARRRPRPLRVRAGLTGYGSAGAGSGNGAGTARRPATAARRTARGRIASTWAAAWSVGQRRRRSTVRIRPVRVDEDLGRQAVDPVQAEDVGRQVGGDRVVEAVLRGVGARRRPGSSPGR